MINSSLALSIAPKFKQDPHQPLASREEHIGQMRAALNVPYNPVLPLPAQSIVGNALDWYGKSSLHGPDRGNLACASMVNEVLQAALNKKYGQDPETVNSVRTDLLQQGGRIMNPRTAQSGDLVLTFNDASLHDVGGATAHIGILLDHNQVLSNSSTRSRFDEIEPVSVFSNKYKYCEIIRPVESLNSAGVTSNLPDRRLNLLI
jgi:hypothetical protein